MEMDVKSDLNSKTSFTHLAIIGGELFTSRVNGVQGIRLKKCQDSDLEPTSRNFILLNIFFNIYSTCGTQGVSSWDQLRIRPFNHLFINLYLGAPFLFQVLTKCTNVY